MKCKKAREGLDGVCAWASAHSFSWLDGHAEVFGFNREGWAGG